MSAIQGEQIVLLTDLPASPVQSVVHAPMATHTHTLSNSETTSPTHGANIRPEPDLAGDTPSGPFDQWEMYPKDSSDYDLLDANINEYRRKLNESNELVGDPTNVETLTMHHTNDPSSPGLG
jgi:hypothetical protein